MNEILRQRRQVYYSSSLKYLRLIFNDHFMLFIVIAIGALGVQYARFLQHGSLSTLEKILLVAIATAASLSVGRLATFLEEADALFLLPKEALIKRSLLSAVARSMALPSAVAVALVLLSMPALRLSAGFLILWAFLIIAAKAGLLYLKVRQLMPAGHLDWLAAISYEKNRQARLLKIYATFTNVKGLTAHARRRRYLDSLLRRTTEGYSYLYQRTYLRTGDYLGLTVRLTVLALLGIAFIPAFSATLIFVTIVNYLLIFQLTALQQAHRYQPLLRIYPLSADSARTSLRQLILGVSSLLLALELLGLLLASPVSWLYSLLFTALSWLLARLYIGYRLKAK